MTLGLTLLAFGFISFLVVTHTIGLVAGGWITVAMLAAVHGLVFRRGVFAVLRRLRRATVTLLEDEQP